MPTFGPLKEVDFTYSLPLSPEMIPLEMVWIQPGQFMMGMPPTDPHFSNEDDPPFLVRMTKGFWISRFTVTQGQWVSLMQINPSYFQDANHPVESVSWYDAMAFCGRLSKFDAGLYARNYRFRLPTEAQLEYSCRAGSDTRYHAGDTIEDLSRVAWHAGNSEGHTHRVGEKEPNAWGLYDMHGNVCEWCYDTATDYPTIPTLNWVHHGDGYVRTCRFGSYQLDSQSPVFNAGARGVIQPEYLARDMGFRVVLFKYSYEVSGRR